MPRSHKRIEELENQAAEFLRMGHEGDATEEMIRQHTERGEPITGYNQGRLYWMFGRLMRLYWWLYEYWRDNEMRGKDD